MPYTSHGHAYGVIDTDQPRPTSIARCGGPRLCKKCAVEAAAERERGSREAIGYVVIQKHPSGVGLLPAGVDELDTREDAAALQGSLAERDPDRVWVACKVVPLVDEQGQG